MADVAIVYKDIRNQQVQIQEVQKQIIMLVAVGGNTTTLDDLISSLELKLTGTAFLRKSKEKV